MTPAKPPRTLKQRVMDFGTRRLGLHRCAWPVFGGAGAILALHRVVSGSPEVRVRNHVSIEMDPQGLEQLIEFFSAQGYDFLSMDDVASRLREGGPRFVAFTFDDGYADTYETAWPAFRRRGLPFTVYVTTGLPDGTAVLWWYLLEDLVRASDRLELIHEGRPRVFPLGKQAEREQAFDAIGTAILQAGEHAPELLHALFESRGFDLKEPTRRLAMGWDHLAEMAEDPLVTIGAHTVHHPALRSLPPEQAKDEIVRSKSILEGRLRRRVRHFAYPYGTPVAVSPRDTRLVKEAGFETAVTTASANVFAQHLSSLEALPRLSVFEVGGDPVRLEMLASGFLPALRNRFKRVITV